MVESPQLLLIVVIIVLTAILLVLGIQAFLVLREVRITVRAANTLLKEVKSGTNIAKMIGTVLALVLGNKLGKNFVDLVSKDKKPEKTTEREAEVIEINVEKPKKIVKRFFRRRSL